MEDEQIIEVEAVEAETPVGADVPPTEQEAAEDSNLKANEFSQRIYELIQEYQAQVPLNYMMKILSATQIDLQAALLGTNITYTTQRLEKYVDERMEGSKSRITLA